MINTREQTQEEQRRQFQQKAHNPSNDKVQAQTEIDHRHYAPIQTALPNEATGYEWKRETSGIQSYQHNQTGAWLHIDSQGQFYDRQAQPISRAHALDHASHSAIPFANDICQSQSITKLARENAKGISI